MFEHETEGDYGIGQGAIGAEWDGLEVFVDEESQEKAAPEYFLEERDDEDEAQEAKDYFSPVEDRAAGEDAWIETGEARGLVKEDLRGDPQGACENADGDRQQAVARRAQAVARPVEDERGGANDGLQGENEIDRCQTSGRDARRLEALGEGEEEDEDSKWRGVSYSVAAHGRKRRT
jgi:hypothetical protein